MTNLINASLNHNSLSTMGSYYFTYQVRYFAGFNYFTRKSEYTS